jgi:hypothetical protein
MKGKSTDQIVIYKKDQKINLSKFLDSGSFTTIK